MLSLLSSIAVPARANLQCAPLQGISLSTAGFLQKFPGVASPDACCQLCGDNVNCTAFTITNDSTCYALKNLAHPAPAKGLVSGYTPSALTHYGE